MVTRYRDRVNMKIAQKSIELFSARVFSLIIKEKYNAIISPGNSGILCDYVTQLVFQAIEMPVPQVIRVPVSRSSNVVPKEKSEGDPLGGSLLFVDDEIRTGTSLHKTMVHLKDNLPKHAFVSVVAENMFFEWTKKERWFSPLFFSYGEYKRGPGNKLSHIITRKEMSTLTRYIPIQAEKKRALALVLGGVVKREIGEVSFYEEGYIHDIKARIPQFEEMAGDIKKRIKASAIAGIAKFMLGEIKFRDG